MKMKMDMYTMEWYYENKPEKHKEEKEEKEEKDN